MHMILGFLLGFLVGILVIPICLIYLPSTSSKTSTKSLKNKKHDLSLKQNSLILQSLHVCTDLYWLNLLISRFWCEIAESQAQAYRLRSFISKYFEVVSNTGLIKNIIVDDVKMDKEAPLIESIRVLSTEECERMFLKDKVEKIKEKEDKKIKEKEEKTKEKDRKIKEKDKSIKDVQNKIKEVDNKIKDDLSNFTPSTPSSDFIKDKAFEEIFRNVNTLLKVNYEGSIRINLKIDLFTQFSFRMEVYVRKIKGDLLLRLPSLDYNTRLEYTFVNPPEIEIAIEAGVSRNEGRAFFKEPISNFIKRTLKFAIIRMFVYPSFSTLILPLVVPTFKKHTHQIKEVTLESKEEDLMEIKDTLSLFLSMDYKIVDTFEGVTFRKNNYLINEKEKVSCFHFSLPESSDLENPDLGSNYLYEGLTIKESKIMNLFYNLTFLKGVISSFSGLKTIHNFKTSSLVEIKIKEKAFEFVRIISKDSIFFQRNDVDNPEFIIFRIFNKELFIFNFTTTNFLNFTRKRVTRLKRKLDLKNPSTSLYKFLNFPKEAYKYFMKKRPSSSENHEGDITRLNNSEMLSEMGSEKLNISKEQPGLVKVFEKFTACPNLLKLAKSYFFDSPPLLIKKILTDEIRLRLIVENTKIYRCINEHDQYKSLAVENCEKGGEDFILHTYSKDLVIMDIVNNKKILFVLDHSTHPGKLSLHRNISDTSVLNFKEGKAINFGPVERKTCLKIYTEKDFDLNLRTYFLESIHTRLRQQEYFDISEKTNFELVEVKKEIKKDFYGDKGGVYFEFRTQYPDDFRLTLVSSQNKPILDIQKIISSRPFIMVMPLNEPDLLSVKLYPKYKKNSYVEMKILNLPACFSKESLISCNIGLGRNQKFIFPTMGSHNFIIFWEKDPDDQVMGAIESPYTQVPITGNGSIRTDNLKYSIVYQNKGNKKRNIKIFMGATLKS